MGIPGFKDVSLKRCGNQLFRRFIDNDLPGIAAELSYYFFFSIFPFLVFVVALTAYLPIQGVVDEALGRLALLIPKEAMGVIQDSLKGLINHPRPKLLSIGVLLTLWSASRSVNALITGLNIAYNVKDRRSYLKIQGIAIGMTLATACLILLAFAAIITGGKLGFLIADHLHVGRLYTVVWSWLRWPISSLIVVTTMAVNYHFLPDVKQGFKFITPGSVISTVLWLLVTWGFTLYAEHFGDYNATYGSIGGVIVLMTWLYLSGLIFLIGGELNAVIDQCAQNTSGHDAPAAPESKPTTLMGPRADSSHYVISAR